MQIKDLTKKYNSKPVVDSVDLEIPKENVISFIGPNGEGKIYSHENYHTINCQRQRIGLFWRYKPWKMEKQRAFKTAGNFNPKQQYPNEINRSWTSSLWPFSLLMEPNHQIRWRNHSAGNCLYGAWGVSRLIYWWIILRAASACINCDGNCAEYRPCFTWRTHQ